MGSALANTVVHVTDTAFMGRVGEVELGAAAIGGIYFFIFMMAGVGLSVGAQIMIARADGEGNHARTGKLAQHTMWLILALSFLLMAIHYAVGKPLLARFVTSDAVAQAANRYLDWRVPGLMPLYLGMAVRSFQAGISRTAAIGQAAVVMGLSNVVFNYALVFGEWGMPRMGIAGAAIASVLSELLSLIYMTVYTIFRIPLAKYGLAVRAKFTVSTCKEILTISSPIMVQMTLSLTSWLFFFVIIEGMGERPLAVSNVVRGVYSVLMVPLLGLAQGTQTLVSNLLGQDRPNDLGLLLKRLSVLAFGLSAIMAVLNEVNPLLLLSVFTNDITLAEASIPVVHILTFTMPFFGIGVVLLSSVSGTGNTLATLAIEVITLILYILFTYHMVHTWHVALEVAWLSEAFYFSFLILFSYLYLRSNRWRTNRAQV